MKTVLNQIKNNFCPVCDVGAPSKLIGYTSRGTCLDYIYDKLRVPYSLAWEIYSNEKDFPEMNAYSKANINGNSSCSSNSAEKNVNRLRNSFLSMNEEAAYELVSTFTVNDLRFRTNKAQVRTYSDDENEYCIKLFNPMTKSNYEYINITWTKALIHLLNYVKDN
jgi:hypothetical protein